MVFFFIRLFKSKNKIDISKYKDVEIMDEKDETETTFENTSDGLLYINIPNIHKKISEKSKIDKAYLLLNLNNMRIEPVEEPGLEIINDSTEILSNPEEFKFSLRELYGNFIHSVKKILKDDLSNKQNLNQHSIDYSNSIIDAVDIFLATISYPLYSNSEYPNVQTEKQLLIKDIWDQLHATKGDLDKAFIKGSEFASQSESSAGEKTPVDLSTVDFDEIVKICEFYPNFLLYSESEQNISKEKSEYSVDSLLYKLGTKFKPLFNKKALRNSEIQKDLDDLKKLLDNETISVEEYEDARKSILKKYYT
jgi:hypothetical protein